MKKTVVTTTCQASHHCDGRPVLPCRFDIRCGNNTLQTVSNGDVSDLTGRPVEYGMLGDIDRNTRVIGLHIYDGLLKFIPFDENGNLLQAFNTNLKRTQSFRFHFPSIVIIWNRNDDE